MVTAMISTITFGQVQSDIRTATLVHGDKTSVYYGASALSQAYNDAADKGDKIILSPGVFNGITIKKSISVYGVGFETDTISSAEPTTANYIYISSTTETDAYGNEIDSYPEVYLEGIFMPYIYNTKEGFRVEASKNSGVLNNLVMKKCKVWGQFQILTSTNNCTFKQCVIRGTTNLNKKITLSDNNNQLNFQNCWILQSLGGSLTGTITYNHCIITDVYDSGYAHYTNCVIKKSLPSDCTAYNNIFTTNSIGTNISGEGNYVNIPLSSIFAAENEDGTYEANKDFALRYPDVHVGTDGTEIGINGGLYPFDRIPSTPRILESNIDLETTSDGKLNVSLKVQAQSK